MNIVDLWEWMITEAALSQSSPWGQTLYYYPESLRIRGITRIISTSISFLCGHMQKKIILGDADPNEYPSPAAFHRCPWRQDYGLSPTEKARERGPIQRPPFTCAVLTQRKDELCSLIFQNGITPLLNPSNGPAGSRFAATRLWREVMMAYWPVCCLSNKASSKRKSSYFSRVTPNTPASRVR